MPGKNSGRNFLKRIRMAGGLMRETRGSSIGKKKTSSGQYGLHQNNFFYRMLVEAIKTRLLHPPQDNLLEAISASAISLRERDVVAVTSKVVALWQGRCISQDVVQDKDELIKQEAEQYLPRENVPGGHVIFTLKQNLLVPSAGIDASNASGYYILWPEHIMQTAEELCAWFKKTYSIKELGVIITDSHSTPFRRGIVGIALAWAGFDPLYDYRQTSDLFGRMLLISQTNIADALAAAAVLAMGEGNEQTPLAVLRDIPKIFFGKGPASLPGNSFVVPLKEDMYAPFYINIPWKKGGRSPQQEN